MDVKYRDQSVGSINLSIGQQLTARRGLDVILLDIPLELRFQARAPGKQWMLSDLSLELFARQPGGATVLLGSGSSSQTWRSATGLAELPTSLDVRCSPRGLVQYEAFRQGGAVSLHCEVRGKIFGLVNLNEAECLANPAPVFGIMEIEFPKESWTSALRSCGLSAAVVVEIPLSGSAIGRSGNGARALFDAFEAFEQGGATAWKNSVGHIRPFLEEWRVREPLQGSEPRDGSVGDRAWKLLNLRDALYKCCHLWVHEPKSSCTREDAQLTIATFAGLLQSVGAKQITTEA